MNILRFITTALVTGLLFGILDAIINGNRYAVKLMECYKPIARKKINIPAGLAIDLAYGFVISGLYVPLSLILPAESGIITGIMYGAGMWFFRVVMNVISSWMMFNIPGRTLVYTLLTGLVEMILLGIVNGLMLNL